jgi:hypothetical protein
MPKVYRIAFVTCTMVPTNDADCSLVVAYMIYYFMQQHMLLTNEEQHAPTLFDNHLDWDCIV